MSNRTSLLALVPLVSVFACSSQAETDYRGEPLAVMHGRVENPLEIESEGDLVAAIAWSTWAGGEPNLISSAATIEGSFPSDFTIELYEPPPPEALINPVSGEVSYAAGMIVALRAEDVGQISSWDDIQGLSLDAGVFYVPDLEDGSWGKENVETLMPSLGTSSEPGYHLVAAERTPVEDWLPCEAQGLCVENVGGSFLDAREFEWCVEYYGEPQTCRTFAAPQDESEEEENYACGDTIVARDAAREESGIVCPLAVMYPGNPDGFERAVTLTLGATTDDWYFYDP